ncbi:MAG: ATP-dependent Clp protease ATP-binding subunit [Coriobacteriia bacterium]|nr:ATP-dependent Clp protease ATP-binding subunit [Coriobacteriia bacterium]
MFERFTEPAKRAIAASQEEARALGQNYVGTEHLLLGLISDSGVVVDALHELEVTPEDVRIMVERMVETSDDAPAENLTFSTYARRVLEHSMREAVRFGHNYVGPEHLLLGIIDETEGAAAQALTSLGLDLERVRATMVQLLSTAYVGAEAGMGARSMSLLDEFGRNLTREAMDGVLDPIIGRKREIDRVVQILSRRMKNNPVLIGEPGVGKTAIVEGLAQLIAADLVPETLRAKQVYSLDISGMVAGSKYRGEFEERMKRVIDEIRKRGDVIVFIDEIHMLVGSGSAEGSIDGANILKPSLARGEFQTIGATTTEEYRKYIEKDSALERRFQQVQVNEPSNAETLRILQGIIDSYESFHVVRYTDEALASAVTLSDRYISDRFMPDKAVDLIDEAGAKMRITRATVSPEIRDLDKKIKEYDADKEAAIIAGEYEKASKLRDKENKLIAKRKELIAVWKKADTENPAEITPAEIAEVLSVWTGIPVTELTSEESKRLMNIEAEMHKRIIGQNKAIDVVSRAIRRSRAGLKDPRRPGGSFIFLGPSGVGKTETAKALAEVVFGSESALISLDMSEFMEKHSVSRLVGSPPGYIGYDEGGQLTERVRRRPYSVILFDEIEKAHPDVFNILLQILEEGRLTDSQGRRVDFRNTVLIMTSNVGARDITKGVSLGFGVQRDSFSSDHLREKITTELKDLFRPEFLNRLDEIVIFDALTQDQIEDISGIMLRTTQEQLALQGLSLRLTDDARKFLAEKGYDQGSGARPLRRAIQRYIDDVLSEELLEGRWKSGDVIEAHLDENSKTKKKTSKNNSARLEDDFENGARLRFEKVKGEKSDVSAFSDIINESIEAGFTPRSTRRPSRKSAGSGSSGAGA